MKVSFVYNQAEAVEAAMRMLARSKTVIYERRKAVIISAVVFGPVMFLAFHAVFRVLLFSVLFGIFTVLLMFAMMPYSIEKQRRKTMARFMREKHGDQNSFTCEVELADKGVSVADQNSQHFFPWEEVEEIVDTANSVDIFAKLGGVVVRNRAFSSPENRAEFKQLAQHHLALARSPTE
jgi:hypothetical protein